MPSVVFHLYNPSIIGRQKRENHNFKVILNYNPSSRLRPAWNTWDSQNKIYFKTNTLFSEITPNWSGEVKARVYTAPAVQSVDSQALLTYLSSGKKQVEGDSAV